MSNTSSLSAFHWRTGEPSIMCNAAEMRKAAHQQANAGKLLDAAGRATVDLQMMPSGISLSRNPQADWDKTSRIRRGGV